MIHITNAILFAAAIAPAFAAPLEVGVMNTQSQQRRELELETREPKITSAQAKTFVKDAVKIGGYAKSGIEFGTTVAPLLPHKNRRSLEDLETRTFHMPSHDSMRAIGGAVAGAAGFAGTVAILNTRPHQRRELEARGQERNFFPKILLPKDRKPPHNIRREETLDAREPNFFSSVVKDVGKVAKFVVREDDQRRELEERNFPPSINHTPVMNRMPLRYAREEALEARNPNFFSTIVKDAGKVAKLVIREDDLEAREPNFFSSDVKDVGKVAKFVVREDDQRRELEERTFSPVIAPKINRIPVMNHFPVINRIPVPIAREETLEARDPNFFSTIVKDAGKVAKLVIRGDELEAREPNFFSSVVKDVGKVAKFVIREDDLDAREPAPEPGFFSALGKGFRKVAGLVIREDENGELYVRDLSDEYYLD